MHLDQFVVNPKDKFMYEREPKGNNGFRNNYINNFRILLWSGFLYENFTEF